MSVVMKNSRQNVAGSLKNMMPTTTVPTAPMPVHTGYLEQPRHDKYYPVHCLTNVKYMVERTVQR